MLADVRIIEPVEAAFGELENFHDVDYLNRLLRGKKNEEEVDEEEEEDDYGLGYDCEEFEHLPTYCHYLAGATLSASRSLIDDECDVAVCWDGGRHHAKRAQSAGYCYINDAVLAILELRELGRVLYIDLDLHHGDGVEEAFMFR